MRLSVIRSFVAIIIDCAERFVEGATSRRRPTELSLARSHSIMASELLPTLKAHGGKMRIQNSLNITVFALCFTATSFCSAQNATSDQKPPEQKAVEQKPPDPTRLRRRLRHLRSLARWPQQPPAVLTPDLLASSLSTASSMALACGRAITSRATRRAGGLE